MSQTGVDTDHFSLKLRMRMDAGIWRALTWKNGTMTGKPHLTSSHDSASMNKRLAPRHTHISVHALSFPRKNCGESSTAAPGKTCMAPPIHRRWKNTLVHDSKPKSEQPKSAEFEHKNTPQQWRISGKPRLHRDSLQPP